jgi:hypothetical protein
MNNNPFLMIIHNIFLNKEERYSLFVKDLMVVGVSVPVWYGSKITSEPAHEVFCKYKIRCTETDLFVRYRDFSYVVHLPLEGNSNANNLLNKEDGGIEYLGFRYKGRLKYKDKYVKVVHLVEIKDIEELTTTL